MKCAGVFLSAMLFSTVSLVAQGGDVDVSASGGSGGCPVAMRAQHRVNGGLMNAHDSTASVPGQRIHLAATGQSDAPRIVSIRVTVHGTSAKARAFPAMAFRDGVSDEAMSFDLNANAGHASAVTSDLMLQGFTSVQTVSLEAVRYADGTNWTASVERHCSIAPDGLMLVSR
jgi:hypothetical protein